LEDLSVDWRIMLNWIFKKWDGESWIRLIWLGIRDVVNAAVNLQVK
jgi:hypothetical protein